jgi:hypothetical protein
MFDKFVHFLVVLLSFLVVIQRKERKKSEKDKRGEDTKNKEFLCFLCSFFLSLSRPPRIADAIIEWPER